MKKIKYTIITIMILLCCNNVLSQALKYSLDTPINEFSGLCKWHNEIFLMPQNHNKINDTIYLIDSTSITKNDTNTEVKDIKRILLEGLKHSKDKNSLNILEMRLSAFDGFEAITRIENKIFLSIETDTSNPISYVIRGIFDSVNSTIQLSSDHIEIPKPYIIDNAGYESLALFGKDSLISFFECNKDSNARAYIFPNSLKGNPQQLLWSKPLYFRLTDVYAISDSEFIGINHLYSNIHEPNGTKERDSYLGVKDSSEILAQLSFYQNTNASLDTSFTQVVKLTIKERIIYWEPLQFISISEEDNYEGIISYMDGVLMVVDGLPGPNKSKLSFFKINSNK